MTTRSDRISVRLEADELVMLRQLAAAQGVSTSAALREMIRDTFARKKLSFKGKATKKPSKKAPAKQVAKRAPAKKTAKKSARK